MWDRKQKPCHASEFRDRLMQNIGFNNAELCSYAGRSGDAAFMRKMPNHLDSLEQTRKQETLNEKPKLSITLINKLLIISASMMLVAAILYASATIFGEQISHGGHSNNTNKLRIEIGSDILSVPENSIRFAAQRKPGISDGLELYLHWPSLSGFSTALESDFNSSAQDSNLVFIRLEERSMQYDMSGRVETIYKRFFKGAAEIQSFGLVRQPLNPDAGYINEDLYYAAASPYPFATRCVRDDKNIATPFCIRDIHVGRRLVLTYRFHKKFLPQWIEIDQALRAHIKSLIKNL